MKILINILIFVFIIPLSLNSQQITFDKLINKGDTSVFCSQAIEDTQNNFILAGYLTDFNEFTPYLLKISQKGEILIESDLGIDKNYVPSDVFDINNAYYIAGYDSNIRGTFFLLKYDYDFNQIWQRDYAFFEPDTFITELPSILNFNSEFIVTGTAGTEYFEDENMFISKIDLEGNILFFRYYPFLHESQAVWDIDQISDTSGYLVCAYHFSTQSNPMKCEIVSLDNDFNITNIQAMDAENEPWDALWGNSSLCFFSDTTFLFASRKVLYDYPPQDEDINVQLLDTSFNLINEVSFGRIDTIEYFPQLQGIDYKYKDAVYVGGNSPYQYVSINWIMLTKLDEEMNICWTKYYGGDASYNLTHVLATNDGGTLLTGTRITDPYLDYDMFIIKVDSAGNTTFATSIHERLNIVGNSIIIYPNPGNNQLKIQTAFQSLGGKFFLYDIKGKLIYQQTITDRFTEINTNSFTVGTYIYSYVLKDKEVETGKWIKQ